MRARHEAAFRAVYTKHHGDICAFFARRTDRQDVQDLAAETFVVAWRRPPRNFDDDPLPWLYGVARNVLRNHHRKVTRRHPPDHAVVPPDPAELVSGDLNLRDAFAQLTPKQREAICLVAWEGLDIAQAATAAGCTQPTFAVRLSRARTRLAALLRDDAPASTTFTQQETPA